ncbi:MAG: SEC-C metal-binding domain-containing protein [Candidatus Nealsonbacteria bacterium]
MENKTRITIGRNDPCPCGSGKKYKKCCIFNKIPKKGVLRLAYNFGTKDSFMARALFQILKIRDFIYKNKEREEFDKKYTPVFQNLFEAKVSKERCMKLIKNHSEKIKKKEICEYKPEDPVIRINETIDNELNMAFKDFFIRGNIAFRGLIKIAGYMGYNISFAFSHKEKYLKKKEKFLVNNSDDKFQKFCEMIENDRKTWRSTFIKMRDAIEHDGFKLPEIKYVLDKNDQIKPIYPTINYQTIEDVLEICWLNLFRFCEDTTVFLLSTKLRDPFIMVSIPRDKRDSVNPIKYKVTVKGPPIGQFFLVSPSN